MNIIDDFVKEFNSCPDILERVLAVEPNAIAMYITGARVIGINDDTSDINVTIIVYKYPKYLNFPEYYELNGIKIRFLCVDLNTVLEYNNNNYVYYPYVNSASRGSVIHYTYTNLLTLNNAVLLWHNPRLEKAYKLVNSNKNNLSIVALYDMYDVFRKDIDDIINGTYAKDECYRYLHYIVFRTQELLSEPNVEFAKKLINASKFSDLSEDDIKTLRNILRDGREYFKVFDDDSVKNKILDKYNSIIANSEILDPVRNNYKNVSIDILDKNLKATYVYDYGNCKLFIYGKKMDIVDNDGNPKTVDLTYHLDRSSKFKIVTLSYADTYEIVKY